jgi:FKBP-type peptidyl-prolyl cis-trans isomerase FklB
MKLKWMAVCAVFVVSGQAWAAAKPALETDKDKLSYSIGASIGKNLRSEIDTIDVNVLVKALKAGLAGEKLLMEEKDIRLVMNEYQTQMRQRAAGLKQQAAMQSKKDGDAYLASYKAQSGVQELKGGVLYKVIKAGDGKKPQATDSVEVNYRGVTIGGKQFDATEAGHPATLKIGSLIAGWKTAVSEMPVGSKWQVVIPPSLAYGENGVGNDIGPNEVLVFDVELVAIK